MTASMGLDLSPADMPSESLPDDAAFDWQNRWYPVSFAEDLPRDRPVRFTLFDQPRVLFFDGGGKIVCLVDRCPHRAARLSDGQVIDGRLECLYHGWQFGAGGQCLHIPQLPASGEKPARSDVRSFATTVKSGILWVWNGDLQAADPSLVPHTPGAEGESVYSVTFQMDLPYDQSYLIENVIDIAHIHIAHHGVRGGGHREAAKPLEFNIEENSAHGIRSTFRSMGLKRSDGDPGLSGALVEFVAPNLIRYASRYSDKSLVAGLELYSLPMGRNRCRLLYRKYSNFTSLRERWKPRWLEHLTQCKILEQDMAVVVGQSEDIDNGKANLKDIWMPLRTSDRLVVEYRKWLDRFGRTLPSYRGFASFRQADTAEPRPPADRHILHTRICSTCGRLYRRIELAIKCLWVTAAIALAAGVAAPGVFGKSVFLTAFLASLLGIALARHLKSKL